jgi:hypothetical protein
MTSRSNLHVCNWPGCRRPVPHDMWGCRSHWFTLPQEIRDSISSAWRFGRGRFSEEWRVANEAALEWVRGIPERIKAMNVGKNTPVPGQGELDVDPDSTAG